METVVRVPRVQQGVRLTLEGHASRVQSGTLQIPVGDVMRVLSAKHPTGTVVHVHRVQLEPQPLPLAGGVHRQGAL